MKKLTPFVCMILVFALFLTIPPQVASAADQRASIFFADYGTDLEKTGTKTFRIWFDVTSNATLMDELGVSEIVVYRSADKQSWSRMDTYRKSIYSQMIAYNTTSHDGYITYINATPGYYYRAYVWFYAKNSRGVGERDVYTEIIKM